MVVIFADPDINELLSSRYRLIHTDGNVFSYVSRDSDHKITMVSSSTKNLGCFVYSRHIHSVHIVVNMCKPSDIILDCIRLFGRRKYRLVGIISRESPNVVKNLEIVKDRIEKGYEIDVCTIENVQDVLDIIRP